MTTESLGLPTTAGNSFNRPADTNAYVSGDLIANVTTTSPQPTPFTFIVADTIDDVVGISRVRLKVNDTAFAGKQVALHLYRNLPTLAVGDNGAFAAGLGASESDKLDVINITFGVATSDGYVIGYGVPSVGGLIITKTSDGLKTIYGILECLAAVTPGSARTFAAVLEIAGRR